MSVLRFGLLALALTSVLPLINCTDAEDNKKGRIVYRKCKACHTLEAGGANKVGPNLHGFLGRAAGTTPGYNYSEALKKAGENGLIWDEPQLDAFLKNPRSFAPAKGHRMSFVGLNRATDRSDVIAYMKGATQ